MRKIHSVRLPFVAACVAVACFAVTSTAAADDVQPLSQVPQGTPVSPDTLEPLAGDAPVPAGENATPPVPNRAPPPPPLPAPQAAGASGALDQADAKQAGAPVLQPWDVDVRAGLHTTPILQYGGISASADAGMRRLGPGTLALGGGMGFFGCGTTCSSTPLSFTQQQLSLEGRATYHLEIPKLANVDFYPLLTAGFLLSRASVKVGDNSQYRASDLAPTIGFGAGASYFFADRFFVGAEARFRYAAGTYSYELDRGPARPFDRSGVDTWNASTVDLALALGGRF